MSYQMDNERQQRRVAVFNASRKPPNIANKEEP